MPPPPPKARLPAHLLRPQHERATGLQRLRLARLGLHPQQAVLVNLGQPVVGARPDHGHVVPAPVPLNKAGRRAVGGCAHGRQGGRRHIG